MSVRSNRCVARPPLDAHVFPEPVPAGAPLPPRKTLRAWMAPLAARDTRYALSLVAIDSLAFTLAIAATIWAPVLALKLLFGLLAGFVIGRLFILGHDACHQSFTRHRRLNRWLGRFVFLPSLTPYSLWATGHNVVHHGYTNLKDFDFVWQPKTLSEFRALPRWRRALERAYRSAWVPWLYYLVEVWWLRMYFPSRRHMPTRRPEFFWDCMLVSSGAVLWLGLLALAAVLSGQSLWITWLAGFVVPFLAWNAMIGFVVYVHHTHPAVEWHDDKSAWANAQPFVSTTVHLRFRPLLGIDMGGLLHHITEHTAHHVDMGVPLYRLRDAQALLEAALPGRIIVQTFSWRWYADTARRCKLYDYERRCWTDFEGRRTSGLGQSAGLVP